MSRKKEQEEPLEAVGHPSITETTEDAEQEAIERFLDDLAGIEEGEISLWLYRAGDKTRNKTFQGPFLKRYSKDVDVAVILEEARDIYGGGDFVLVAKKEGVIFRRVSFSCEAPPKPKEESVDAMAKLSDAVEKLAVVDKVGRIIKEAREEKDSGRGNNQSIDILLTMLRGVQEQNNLLLQAIIERKSEPLDVVELIKLGSSLAEGRVPGEQGGDTWEKIIGALTPVLPAIIGGLASRPHPLPGVSAPTIPPAVPPAGLPGPGAPSLTKAGSGGNGVPTTDEVAARILDEIRFVLRLPVSERLLDHVIDFIDAYAPGLLTSYHGMTEDQFVSYAGTLDPGFAARADFFKSLYGRLKNRLEAESEPEGA